MPVPHYIIGSQHRSEDRHTGFLSYFIVIEQMEVAAAPLPAGTPPNVTAGVLDANGINLHFSASWMRTEEESPDLEYEGQWRVMHPDWEQPKLIHTVEKLRIPKRFYRFGLNMRFGAAKLEGDVEFDLPESGIHVVENRIRLREEGSAWITQRFPFWVNYVNVEDSEPSEG
jgi:hypothetical protein